MSKPTDFSKLPWVHDWATHRALCVWNLVRLIEFDHKPILFIPGVWEYGIAEGLGRKAEIVHKLIIFKATSREAENSVECRPPWNDPVMEKILFNATLAAKDLNSLWHEIIDDSIFNSLECTNG